MTYDELLAEADCIGLDVKELPLKSGDGRINGRRIAIRQDIPTTKRKADVLAEEIGHYRTGAGRIIELDTVAARKQEQKARLEAYDKRVGLSGIIQGYRHRCQSRHELAEYLDVSEELLKDAIDCYHAKYGQCVELDSCVILFDPVLAVIEKL